MKPTDFKRTYYPDNRAGLRRNRVESSVCCGAGRPSKADGGDHAIGNNLFGITAGDKWTGKRRTERTFEYFSDDRQSGRFEKVYSITRTSDGRYRYEVDRKFRDYDTPEEGIRDHAKVLSAQNATQ